VCAEKPPSLEIQPNKGVVAKQIGGSMALTCKPNVQDPRQISELQWSDSKNRRIESTNRANPIFLQQLGGEPGLVLIFQKLQENEAGNYTCTANYGSEQLRATATVITFVDITFVDAPESQYPRVGEDFLVKCKVQGNPTPVVDWNKDDRIIQTNDKFVVQNEGLLIKNVRETDDGSYKCTAVVLSTGHIKTKNIKVEVLIPPEIQAMNEVSVIEGETASTKCVATGKPPPTYIWIKEHTSQDLSKTDRFDVKKNTGDLIITKVESNDDGVYKCTAENPAGRVESKVKINVLVKPKIFELLNVTAPVGAETKIICKTRGRPVPRVIFRKLSNKEPFKGGQQANGRIILSQESFEGKGESYGVLEILKLNRSDDGLYECIADNTAGTSYKNGHITVEFPPTFARTKDLPVAWSWENNPGNLTCIPEAIPNATITWKYNGIEIQPDSLNFKQIGNGPVSSLIVKPQGNHRFFTKYECIARNKLGSSTILLELKEAKVPGDILQIKMESYTATTVKFGIVPPTHFTTLPIRSFTVQYKLERDISWDFARNHTWSYNAPYILENLTPERTYHFRFRARNDVGFGPWKNAPILTMPRRSEPAEPKIFVPTHSLQGENSSNRQDVIAVSPYADHFELRWSVPNDNGDPIDSYQIRYCVTQKVNGGWQDSECSEEIKQSVQYTSYELNALRPDTIYKIELRAHNTIGLSSPAQIKVKTARGIDPAVPFNEPKVTSAAIIGIVVVGVILVLILVDLICFCVNRAGILALICDRNKSKHHEEDPKLGSYKAAPAHPNSLNLPLPVKLASSPMEEREPLKSDGQMNGERNMSVEFDGKHVYSKSGEIIGKHSAV
ncbi:fasciclin-2, partial [Asbolus verrucosus]